MHSLCAVEKLALLTDRSWSLTSSFKRVIVGSSAAYFSLSSLRFAAYASFMSGRVTLGNGSHHGVVVSII